MWNVPSPTTSPTTSWLAAKVVETISMPRVNVIRRFIIFLFSKTICVEVPAGFEGIRGFRPNRIMPNRTSWNIIKFYCYVRVAPEGDHVDKLQINIRLTNTTLTLKPAIRFDIGISNFLNIFI